MGYSSLLSGQQQEVYNSKQLCQYQVLTSKFVVLTSCRWWEIEPHIQVWPLILVSWGQLFVSSSFRDASLLSSTYSWASEHRFFSPFYGLDPSFSLLSLSRVLSSNVPQNTEFAAFVIIQASDSSPLPRVSWHFSGLPSFCNCFSFKFS